MSERKQFSRQELYDLVWSTAMTTLAKQFGMSDVGVRKICVKHDIPTPPAGYWAKLQFGKKVKKIPLPAATDGVRDRVFVSIYTVQQLPEAVVAADLKAREILTDPIAVPPSPPNRPHRVTSATTRVLKAAKANGERFVTTEDGPSVITAQVGKESIPRVAIIIEAIVRTLERLGHQIVDGTDGADLVVDGEKMRLSLHESLDKHTHQPTTAELAEKARWDANRVKWPTLYRPDRRHWRSWDYSPSGRLSLVLENPKWTGWSSDRILGRWHDRKSTTVEQQLNDVVVAMHAGAALIRHNRAAAEERHRLQQEAAERRQRERDRQDRIAKREAFVQRKSQEYTQLVELRRFSEYLARETLGSDIRGASAIASVARDMVERLEDSLSASSLKEEVEQLKLYADGDLPEEC
jgi:hypothetical protein